jgi:hypothetical protein
MVTRPAIAVMAFGVARRRRLCRRKLRSLTINSCGERIFRRLALV